MPRRPPRPRASDCETIARAFLDSPTALVITDAHHRIVAANRAYRRQAGRSGAALPDTLPCLRCDESAGPKARRSGVRARVALQVAMPCHVAQAGCPCETWRHRAEHDPLTGLPNRGHLESELARALARAGRHGQRLAVLFVDLDGFKAVNDGHGHASGDGLIRRVGTRLRDTLRAEDLVARFGGDEFVVVLEAPRRDADAATAAAALLRAVRDCGADAEAGTPPVTASIGVALYPDHACDAAGLLKVADHAMYCAKRAGGNAFAFGDTPGEIRAAGGASAS